MEFQNHLLISFYQLKGKNKASEMYYFTFCHFSYGKLNELVQHKFIAIGSIV